MSLITQPKVPFRAFVQARMSSKRFPGKVLARFKGRPVIEHVIEKISEALDPSLIVIATSEEESDDPLVEFVRQQGQSVFRGPLENVFGRFRECLAEYPCDWFFRISADSPLLDPSLFKKMIQIALENPNLDLVTNVLPRTFPRGQSVELLKSATFSSLNMDFLSEEEIEHCTKHYYLQSERFQIVNLESGIADFNKINLCVDTIEDLKRLEQNH